MWWPRLFTHHGDIAWDDYEKDYSDLPEEVLSRHRCWGSGRGWQVQPCRAAATGSRHRSAHCALALLISLPHSHPSHACRVAEAIKDDERRAETLEREKREALQARGRHGGKLHCRLCVP